ncbi:DUF1499 domain-containing protein [Futiania mangrovi]|uniref:DUF1499 domain-containing protein n=1 Tax=Futiania mangrovi TaxID=2959716 RepID=A0A9J6PFD1_9PROT|nr:DUF1499 domain-containing protein [Futiania mangrovii]MCP1337425.1 DUF1499 domain-containing protein [Futiania mangrovii]
MQRRRFLRAGGLALAAMLLAAGIVAVTPGARAWIWAALFGPPDLGAVDFRTLERPGTPNAWLVCPKDHCPAAQADAAAPVFAVAAPVLFAAVREAARAEPLTREVAADEAAGTLRFVTRTPLMHYPDTVSVEVLDLGPERSTLALYSRSQIGRSDFGTNARRAGRWLARLKQALPVAEE